MQRYNIITTLCIIVITYKFDGFDYDGVIKIVANSKHAAIGAGELIGQFAEISSLSQYGDGKFLSWAGDEETRICSFLIDTSFRAGEDFDAEIYLCSRKTPP